VAQGYRKVFNLFRQNLTKKQPSRTSTNAGSVTSMTQDILFFLLPYLSTQNASELFDATFSNEVLVNADNAVQKRGYKILARLVESGKLSLDAEQLFKQLGELSDGLSSAAKKVNSYDYSTWTGLELSLLGSTTTVCEPAPFDPSLRFTRHSVFDP
jgi:ribosomal RNA-processing protein 12